MTLSDDDIGIIIGGILCFIMLVIIGHLSHLHYKSRQEREHAAHLRFLANLNP
jgi:hypothetical protein